MNNEVALITGSFCKNMASVMKIQSKAPGKQPNLHYYENLFESHFCVKFSCADLPLVYDTFL